jgi:hypothetical protein
MFKNKWPLATLAAILAASTTLASAHEIVGNRFFPATLVIDDPGVNDELAFPTVSISKRATFHHLSSSISRANMPSASPRILASRSRRPGRAFMRPVDQI